MSTTESTEYAAMSRRPWRKGAAGPPKIEELTYGALLRIAEALEELALPLREARQEENLKRQEEISREQTEYIEKTSATWPAGWNRTTPGRCVRKGLWYFYDFQRKQFPDGLPLENLELLSGVGVHMATRFRDQLRDPASEKFE